MEVVIIIEYIWYWMSLIPGWSMMLYLRVIPIFQDEYTFYEVTKRQSELKHTLNAHAIFLSDTLLESLGSTMLKEQVRQRYLKLKEENIIVISYFSPHYPKTLKSCYYTPFCLLVKGDLKILHNKKYFIYYDTTFSKYGEKMYHLLYEYIYQQGGTLMTLENSNTQANIRDGTMIFTTETALKKQVSQAGLAISVPNVVQEIDRFRCLGMLADIVIIPEGNYEAREKIGELVESALEANHDVFVIPGNIYRKSSYFSNYLIKQGANILLNRHDLDTYLKRNIPVDNF